MNIPTSFLPTSFESPTTPRSPDQNIPAADDFSSLMASMWCGPAAIIAPMSEIPAGAEPAEQTISVDGEPGLDKELFPLSNFIDPTAVKGGGVEIPFTEQIDLSSPEQVAEGAVPTEVVPTKVPTEVDTIESYPLETSEDKAPETVAPESLPRLTSDDSPSPALTLQPPMRIPIKKQPIKEEPASEKPTSGFTRLPIDLEPAPVDPKVNTPIRRTTAFGAVDPASASLQLPNDQQIEIKVESEQRQVEELSTPKLLPQDQLTAEAIKREANLAASYLAQSGRESRDGGIQALKAQLTGSRPEVIKIEAAVDLKESSTNQTPFSLTANGAVETKASSVESTEVISQLAKPILEIVNTIPPKQTRSIRIRLRPEELGQVDVQLSRDAAGKVSAQMIVERENARQILSQTLPQLRQTLEQAGLVVDQLQVSSDSSSFAGGARNQDHQSAENSSRTSFTEPSTTAIGTTEQVRDHKLLSLNA